MLQSMGSQRVRHNWGTEVNWTDSALISFSWKRVDTIFFFFTIYTINQRKRWHPTPVLLPGKPHGRRSLVGCSPWGRWVSDMTERLHFHFPALEKEMATHSSVLAWRIPGTGKAGGLLSMGSHRVGRDWSDLAVAAAYNKQQKII